MTSRDLAQTNTKPKRDHVRTHAYLVCISIFRMQNQVRVIDSLTQPQQQIENVRVIVENGALSYKIVETSNNNNNSRQKK